MDENFRQEHQNVTCADNVTDLGGQALSLANMPSIPEATILGLMKGNFATDRYQDYQVRVGKC